MKRLIFRMALLAALAAALVLPAGCGEPQAATSSSPGASATAPQSNRWLDLLQVIPATDNTTRAAFLQDYAYLTDKQEQYPQASANYTVLNRDPPTLFAMMNYSNAEWEKSLGFTKSDVDQTAYAYHEVPIDYYVAARGRFSNDQIDNAVKTGPLNDVLKVVPYAGQQFYSWDGDWDMHLSWRSNLRPLGRGMRLGLFGNLIFWTMTTKDMEDMIDSDEGNIKSLADLQDYQLLAQGLSELDTVSAFFSSESQAQSHIRDVFKQMVDNPQGEGQQVFAQQVNRQVELKPFQAFATGAGLDKKGYYLAIVLLNPDEETARSNASVLAQQIESSKAVPNGKPWSDFVDSIDVRSEGRLTLAKVYGPIATDWSMFDMVMGPYDPLLMCQG